MPHVRIITDSTSDLSPDLIDREQIKVVNLKVQFGSESYQDRTEMNTDKLFRLVEEKKQLPTTASPSPADFLSVFQEATAGGNEAIYIGISEKFSSTLQNARIAAGMLSEGKVTVFDSANLSTGIGLQVLLACDLAREGKSSDEIVAVLEATRPKVRTAFIINTLDYLHKGGRCNGVQALLGSLLRIRPVIAVEDGGMIVATKIRGARHKSLDWMLDRFAACARQGRVDPRRVFITHTGVPEDVAYMADKIRQTLPELKELLVTRAGSVIGSHSGPGTIGMIYVEENQ